MAALNSTVDGMGFEEVNQSSSTEMISGTNLYGVNVWVSDMGEINIVSGATFSGGDMRITTDVSIGDALTCRTLAVNDNRVYSNSIQNATELFGYQVKAGSLTMGAVGYSGLIQFVDGGSFSTANYFITLSARNWTLPIAANTGSTTSYGISGIRRASGCWAFGPSGTEVDWIAVGI